MTPDQDTSAQASAVPAPSGRPARPVFLVGQDSSFPPAATAAETIFQAWQALPAPAPPALLLAAPDGYAALVDHLRVRVLAAPRAGGVDVPALQDLTHAAIDGGATLIAGGLPAGEHGWQASLFVHVSAHSRLLAADAPVGPCLAVIPTSEDHPVSAVLAELQEPLSFQRLNADGRIDPSPHSHHA